VFMTELTSNFLRVSKFLLDYSLILNNDFLEPLNLFQKDSSKHNLKIFKELEGIVTNLEKSKKLTKGAKETYYQFSANAEKLEERLKSMFERIEKGQGNPKDLPKETEKVAQMKMNAQEAKIEYEQKCKESTNFWGEFKNKFLENFQTFDLKEENRIDQIKRKTLTLCQNLRAFHKNENPIVVGFGSNRISRINLRKSSLRTF
jgi:tryptophanyl-tRNA synthetase